REPNEVELGGRRIARLDRGERRVEPLALREEQRLGVPIRVDLFLVLFLARRPGHWIDPERTRGPEERHGRRECGDARPRLRPARQRARRAAEIRERVQDGGDGERYRDGGAVDERTEIGIEDRQPR